MTGRRSRVTQALVHKSAISRIVQQSHLAPGHLTLCLDPAALAQLLNINPDPIAPASLVITSAFTMRRRGVETRLVLGTEPQRLDRKLIRNIATALAWLERIKAGQSQAEIAAADGIPVWRVQQALHYAFLAPDIIRQVLQAAGPLLPPPDAKTPNGDREALKGLLRGVYGLFGAAPSAKRRESWDIPGAGARRLGRGEWLAGALGFEPRYVGTKNRCLTTWRRPNSGAVHIQGDASPQDKKAFSCVIASAPVWPRPCVTSMS